jgi:hypothetical protein
MTGHTQIEQIDLMITGAFVGQAAWLCIIVTSPIWLSILHRAYYWQMLNRCPTCNSGAELTREVCANCGGTGPFTREPGRGFIRHEWIKEKTS